MRITRNQLRQIIQEELIPEQNQGKTGYADADAPRAPSGSRIGTGRGRTRSTPEPIPGTLDDNIMNTYESLVVLLNKFIEQQGSGQSALDREKKGKEAFHAEMKKILAASDSPWNI